ncbi:flotillin family protein [Hydrogenophaga luteola]|uniref:Inner membrane protein YqiK n=1 Tax=Hydrogenophaga luteola TaxID=1591122 RepID=A0ABV7W091_9BURK
MEPILVSAGIAAFLLLCFIAMFAKFYRKIEQGHALIINTLRAEPEVTFTGRMVYPIIHKAELMEISVKTIEIDRSGNEGLICRDNIRADIKVKFFVRVNKTADDVLKVAQSIGCERASNQETLEELFSAKFSEALKTVGKAMDFVDLYQARDRFRDEIIAQIGNDLSGYVLDDAAIDYLEQTPLSKLDANNILDAQGIKKITELTATEHVRTNELRRNEELQIKKKNVETQESLLELERQAADAQARQAREVATVKAREEAETLKIQAEEKTKSELARLQAEQSVSVQQENVLREKEVAENNRKRAVAIEEEKVIRARELEVVDREKEVTLQKIEKDKAVEVQKKAIADVIRERIVVERTVAEQEEAIKELRVVAEADRTKQSTVIMAEGQAEEKLIIEVKAAEAQERKARHKATEETTLAEARLKVAEKEAEAKKREAEGLEAITAAPGLAQAKVTMVTADAVEKQGMADVHVRAAGAEATLKEGQAEAQVIELRSQAEAVGVRAKMEAEATGKEKLGLAEVQVRLADADAVVKAGQAEAATIEARFQAEAKGLREKFEAMSAMSGETRAHEEFRMQLEKAHVETVKGIDAQTSIAREQAEVLGTALSNAKIDIVGGQGDYFDRFVGALSVGKGIDGVVNKSKTLQVAFKDQLAGERDVVPDLQNLLGALGSSSGELQNLTVAGLLAKVMREGNDSQKAALQTLLNGMGKS